MSADPITLEVNGEARELPRGATVAQLLESLELPATGVAVAVNRAVVPRSQHAAFVLSEGCRVEILRAVGGG